MDMVVQTFSLGVLFVATTMYWRHYKRGPLLLLAVASLSMLIGLVAGCVGFPVYPLSSALLEGFVACPCQWLISLHFWLELLGLTTGTIGGGWAILDILRMPPYDMSTTRATAER